MNANHIRLRLAQRIAGACPPALFDESALTGSTARNIATEQSDLEINFWVRELPPTNDRAAWLTGIGISDIHVHPDPRPDQSYWISGVYEQIEVELGWQTAAAMTQTVDLLLSAQTTDHKMLRLGDLIITARPLRGSGWLRNWQDRLRDYPPALAQRLIATVRDEWANGEITRANLCRAVFALNHHWEVNWKYLAHILPELYTFPADFAARAEQSAELPALQREISALLDA